MHAQHLLGQSACIGDCCPSTIRACLAAPALLCAHAKAVRWRWRASFETQQQVPVIACTVCGANQLTIDAYSRLHLQTDVAEVTETFSQQGEKVEFQEPVEVRTSYATQGL